MADDVVSRTFRALSESADKKFARVRHLPLYYTGGQSGREFPKVFKAYTRLWEFQQANRRKLVETGLNRWEIGEIASRIGQLYFTQYMRTSEMRYLIGAYNFYEAILSRKYFDGSEKDRSVRFKELRFYARFLMVSLMFNKLDMVNLLVENFNTLIQHSRAQFPETNFTEWKQVIHEILRFTKADSTFPYTRPLRYSITFDSNPNSEPYITRFHAKKVLKFREAVLTSYNKNEVKFAEQTLDTLRMLQCLEWEPNYQKHPVEIRENGGFIDHSVTSGRIEMNLVTDNDPNLPPFPKKALLHRLSVTQLISVIATICSELPPESVMLIYLSASGFSSNSNTLHTENHTKDNETSSEHHENYLWLGPCREGGSNFLYPGDLIPFTRRPLFLIIDSDNSHAFKVLHGVEMDEKPALLLSPLKPSYKNLDVSQNGNQFTFFLSAPLQAFCQLIDFIPSEYDVDMYNEGESVISNAFSEWEIILCTSNSLDLVWAQVLSDPLLRRLILRFIFCRAVLTHFCGREGNFDEYMPICVPELPDSVGPYSEDVISLVMKLVNHFKVGKDCFQFYV